MTASRSSSPSAFTQSRSAPRKSATSAAASSGSRSAHRSLPSVASVRTNSRHESARPSPPGVSATAAAVSSSTLPSSKPLWSAPVQPALGSRRKPAAALRAANRRWRGMGTHGWGPRQSGSCTREASRPTGNLQVAGLAIHLDIADDLTKVGICEVAVVLVVLVLEAMFVVHREVVFGILPREDPNLVGRIRQVLQDGEEQLRYHALALSVGNYCEPADQSTIFILLH